MLTALKLLLSLVLLASAGFLAVDMADYYLYSPWTRDARITADVITVAPDVTGYVTDVKVRNDQFVHKGDVLFLIDPDRFRIALSQAEASVAASLAQFEMLTHQDQRRAKLSNLAVAPEVAENAHRQAQSAGASYQQALASRDLAALNLRRTEVKASVNGFVSNLTLSVGDYAMPGKPVLAVVDSDSYRVDAYFEETKIAKVKSGAAVDIRLMDGTPALQGRVASVARGITNQDNPDGPQLLANVNPIFTWVRLAQRIPVRISLTGVPPDRLISAGMTCTVILRDGEEPDFLVRIRQRLKSWL
jgi:multidrug resistance efflux pump